MPTSPRAASNTPMTEQFVGRRVITHMSILHIINFISLSPILPPKIHLIIKYYYSLIDTSATWRVDEAGDLTIVVLTIVVPGRLV